MKNVVGYCRVSTKEQANDDRYGLDAQKKEIMEYCADHDMQISDWFIDRGESGVKDTRPEFDRLLFGEVSNPPVQAVVVSMSDRVAREIKLYFYFKQLLYQKDIELVSVQNNFGEMGAFAGILEAFVMFAAEQERAHITKRTSAGRTVKAIKGGYSGGKPPYGYRPVGGRLVVVPEEAEIIRKIFHLRDGGATYLEVINMLKKNGHVTRGGKDFPISTIQVILGNRKLYEGFYKYGKQAEWVEGQHEAILPLMD